MSYLHVRYEMEIWAPSVCDVSYRLMNKETTRVTLTSSLDVYNYTSLSIYISRYISQ